jgi:hypothetical protein
MDDLRNLVAKEPESPLPRYFLAKALETRGEVEAARDAYAEARERMYGYLGCILSLNAIAERVAREEGAAFADIRSRIEREGRGADPYLDRLIYDYCHLNAAGMAIAVDEVARAIRDANLLPAGADRVETRRSGR